MALFLISSKMKAKLVRIVVCNIFAAAFAIITILWNIKVDSPLSRGNQIAGSSTRNTSFKEIKHNQNLSWFKEIFL